jgi:2,4-dienoyl-CoA reductase-like NADH-dependent reductase (Old Yellow Enzyme family)
MTRSLRVSHASVAKRDPHLAEGVETLLAAAAGVAPARPTALPFRLGDRRAASRICVCPADGEAGDDRLVALGGAAAQGAGLVITQAVPVGELADDDAAVDWQRVVEYVHAKGALIAVRLVVGAALEAAVERAAFAGFDLAVLDPGDDPARIEQLPAAIQAARPRWRPGCWLAAVVHDRPSSRAAVVGYAAQLVRASANLLWVQAPGDGNARLPAAPLADRLRNELSVPTAIACGNAMAADLDAAIAAGRADLVAVPAMPK